MQLYRIGLAFALLSFLTPTFANQCPSADKVRSCSGGACTFQRLAGWSESIYYTDQGKPFSFHKADIQKTSHGSTLSCYYAYIDPVNNRTMPTALVLVTNID